MIVHILPGGHRGLRLWVPLLLIWILLLPLLLVLLPVYLVACAVLSLRPWKTFAALAWVLGSLGGTHIEIASRSAAVLVHIY
jgi:hypothetical protein